MSEILSHSQMYVTDCDFDNSFITNRINVKGNVFRHVCPFPFYLFEWTGLWSWFFACVWVTNIACRDCQLLQNVSICPIFTPNKRVNKHLSHTRITFKLSYLYNYIAYSNQSLHSNKNHQLCHLKENKNGHISATAWPIGTEFGTVMHTDPPNRISSSKF